MFPRCADKRRNPGFNERAYGFRSFNDMLLEAQKRSLLKLEADEKSGGYRVQAVDQIQREIGCNLGPQTPQEEA